MRSSTLPQQPLRSALPDPLPPHPVLAGRAPRPTLWDRWMLRLALRLLLLSTRPLASPADARRADALRAQRAAREAHWLRRAYDLHR